MDCKLKHLEFIQDVITRMGRNSFALKGWTVTIVAALFALSFKAPNSHIIWIGIIPIVLFWYLDSFYLQQERLYRSLYDKVRQLNEDEIDFSMKASFKEFDRKENRLLSCVKSKTELSFYGILSLILIFTIIIF